MLEETNIMLVWVKSKQLIILLKISQAHIKFLQPGVTSYNCLFCQIKQSKPQNL